MELLSFKKFIDNTHHITTIDDVLRYARYLVFDLGLCFHPDDTFDQYVDSDTQKRCFTDAEAAIGDRLMDECFKVCERENLSIYTEMGKAMDEYNEKYFPGIMMPKYGE